MIARIWRGQSTAVNAEAYQVHVTEDVFPKLKHIAGHRGAYLLRRATDDRVEFLAVTLWESIEAIRRFSGNDVTTAVVEPEARGVLAEFDDFATHYEVRMFRAVPRQNCRWSESAAMTTRLRIYAEVRAFGKGSLRIGSGP